MLVHEFIPGSAVFASIPLLSLLERLPSYFLRPEASPLRGTPLASIAWDYREKKPSFRHFCQQMSDSFLQSSPDVRLRDTTAASVRLAAVFLRPWFHQMVSNEFDIATATLRDLSFLIAQWPGQWWTRDHTEMWDLIRTMVLALAEEVREKQRLQTEAEVMRLQDTVDELEGVVKQYQEEVIRNDHAHVSTPQINSSFSFPDQTLASEPQTPLLARRSLVITIPTSSDGSHAPPSPLAPEIFSGHCRPTRNSLRSDVDPHDLFSMPRPGPGIDSGLMPTIPLRFPSPEILSSRSIPHLPFSLLESVSPKIPSSPLPPSPKAPSPTTGLPPTPPPEITEYSGPTPPSPSSRSASPTLPFQQDPPEDDQVNAVEISPSPELDALFSKRRLTLIGTGLPSPRESFIQATSPTEDICHLPEVVEISPSSELDALFSKPRATVTDTGLPSPGESSAQTTSPTEDIAHPPKADVPPVYRQPINQSPVLPLAKTPLATENPLKEATTKGDALVSPKPSTPKAMRPVRMPSIELPVEDTRWRCPSAVETASCLLTGFVVGAFITLCILSPQRRTLITHLT